MAYQQLPDPAKPEVLDRAIANTRASVTRKEKPIIMGRILSDVRQQTGQAGQ